MLYAGAMSDIYLGKLSDILPDIQIAKMSGNFSDLISGIYFDVLQAF